MPCRELRRSISKTNKKYRPVKIKYARYSLKIQISRRRQIFCRWWRWWWPHPSRFCRDSSPADMVLVLGLGLQPPPPSATSMSSSACRRFPVLVGGPSVIGPRPGVRLFKNDAGPSIPSKGPPFDLRCSLIMAVLN